MSILTHLRFVLLATTLLTFLIGSASADAAGSKIGTIGGAAKSAADAAASKQFKKKEPQGAEDYSLETRCKRTPKKGQATKWVCDLYIWGTGANGERWDCHYKVTVKRKRNGKWKVTVAGEDCDDAVGSFVWEDYPGDPREQRGRGRFDLPDHKIATRAAQTSCGSVAVIVGSAATPYQIINYLPGTPFTTSTVKTTTTANDTVLFSGATPLSEGTEWSFNIQTTPDPALNMPGEVRCYAAADGTGPFQSASIKAA